MLVHLTGLNTGKVHLSSVLLDFSSSRFQYNSTEHTQ